MAYKFPALFLTALLCACSLPPQHKWPQSHLSGKVSLHNQGVNGVIVSAWPSSDLSAMTGKAPFRSAPTAPDGSFTMDLPPGEYYLIAKNNHLFSFYGRNPLTIPEQGITDLKLGCLPLPPPAQIDSVTIDEGISGEIISADGPLSGAVVYAYTDLSSHLKGMGYAISTPTDEHGRYELALPPGTYYLLTRMRKDGRVPMGPLRAGDFFGYAPQNPVRVTGGRVTLISIPALEVPEKIDQLSSSLFGQTSIQGRIVNRHGEPVAGIRALLYTDAQMLNRPDFVSQPSERDGSFVISFPQGGTYFLAARQQLGGAPSPGELYGTYDDTPDHSFQIKTGEQRSNIKLLVEEMW